MKDTSGSNNCVDSDFDTRSSAKKICFTNGMEFEVIAYETLRITANGMALLGSYELWIYSHHVDSTASKLWSVRATPLTITITNPVISITSPVINMSTP